MRFFGVFGRFFSIFDGFGKDFGSILEGFFDYFLYFFRKRRKRVEVNKTLRGRMNFKGRLLKKHAKIAAKLKKNAANLRLEKNTQKNCLEI